jgi:chaperonin GroES
MRSGDYRKVELTAEGDDDQASRIILEQHRMIDLDDDGLEEPYIVTVDARPNRFCGSRRPGTTTASEHDDERPALWCWRSQNQALEPVRLDSPSSPTPRAGPTPSALATAHPDHGCGQHHHQHADRRRPCPGGGRRVHLRRGAAAGRRASRTLTFQPGEYKTVNASGADLRNAIYERTFPAAPRRRAVQAAGPAHGGGQGHRLGQRGDHRRRGGTAPVGTTLALIEQGQQVFNAIYKRIYRALRQEFKLRRNSADCTTEARRSPDEFAAWLDDPTTRFVMDGLRSLALKQEEAFKAAVWNVNEGTPGWDAMRSLRDRCRSKVECWGDLTNMTVEDTYGANGLEPPPKPEEPAA